MTKTKFGRCNVPGHGSKCVVSKEIQEQTLNRSHYKRETMREVEDSLKDVEIYGEPLDDYHDLLTLKMYLSYVKNGVLISSDGFGHPVKGNFMAGDIFVSPKHPEGIPLDATHIAWYNK